MKKFIPRSSKAPPLMINQLITRSAKRLHNIPTWAQKRQDLMSYNLPSMDIIAMRKMRVISRSASPKWRKLSPLFPCIWAIAFPALQRLKLRWICCKHLTTKGNKKNTKFRPLKFKQFHAGGVPRNKWPGISPWPLLDYALTRACIEITRVWVGIWHGTCILILNSSSRHTDTQMSRKLEVSPPKSTCVL